MAAEAPTEAEFADWIPAPLAVAFLRNQNHWGHYETVGTVLHLIADNEISAVARKAVLRRDGREVPNALWPIPKDWWAASPAQHDTDTFWTTGHIQFDRSRVASHYTGVVTVSCTDVRFKREHIARVVLPTLDAVALAMTATAPAPTPAPVPAGTVLAAAVNPSAGHRKVGRKELLEWCADFGKRNPGAPFDAFLLNAKLAFKPRPVTERPLKEAIAELKLTLSVGNPSILQKNRRIEDA